MKELTRIFRSCSFSVFAILRTLSESSGTGIQPEDLQNWVTSGPISRCHRCHKNSASATDFTGRTSENNRHWSSWDIAALWDGVWVGCASSPRYSRIRSKSSTSSNCSHSASATSSSGLLLKTRWAKVTRSARSWAAWDFNFLAALPIRGY